MHVIKRWAVLLWWLLKSLLLKLTPARRVMLAISLVLLVSGIQTVSFEAGAVSFRFPLIGTLLLLLVLMLELKDKLLARDELEAGARCSWPLMPDRSPSVPAGGVAVHAAGQRRGRGFGGLPPGLTRTATPCRWATWPARRCRLRS